MSINDSMWSIKFINETLTFTDYSKGMAQSCLHCEHIPQLPKAATSNLLFFFPPCCLSCLNSFKEMLRAWSSSPFPLPLAATCQLSTKQTKPFQDFEMPDCTELQPTDGLIDLLILETSNCTGVPKK